MSKEKYLRNLGKRKSVVDARSVDNNTNVIHKPKKRKKTRSKRSGLKINSVTFCCETIKKQSKYEAQKLLPQTLTLYLCLIYLLTNLLACNATDSSSNNNLGIEPYCPPAFVTQSPECLDQMIEIKPSPNQDSILEQISQMDNPIVVGSIAIAGIEPTPFGEVVFFAAAGTYLVISDGNMNVDEVISKIEEQGFTFLTLNSTLGEQMLARFENNPIAMAGLAYYAYVVNQDGTIMVGEQAVEPSGEGIGNDIDITTALTLDITDQLSNYPDLKIENVVFDDGVVFINLESTSFDDIPFPEDLLTNFNGSQQSQLLKTLVESGRIVFVGDFSSDLNPILPEGTADTNESQWHHKFNTLGALTWEEVNSFLDLAIELHLDEGKMHSLSQLLQKYYSSQHRVVDSSGTIPMNSIYDHLIKAAVNGDVELVNELKSQIENTEWYYVEVTIHMRL